VRFKTAALAPGSDTGRRVSLQLLLVDLDRFFELRIAAGARVGGPQVDFDVRRYAHILDDPALLR
jgi:hypothetical protein